MKPAQRYLYKQMYKYSAVASKSNEKAFVCGMPGAGLP